MQIAQKRKLLSHQQQVASLASKRDASPTNSIVPQMLWPTSVSTERKYERRLGKKVTPSFNLDPINDLTNTLPQVQDVHEIDYKAFKMNKKESEKKKDRSPLIRSKKKRDRLAKTHNKHAETEQQRREGIRGMFDDDSIENKDTM